MIYFTAYEESMRNTAGAKAPTDIKELCLKRGYQFAKVLPPPENMPSVLQKAWKLKFCHKFWKQLEDTMQAGDVLLYQHPMYITKAFADSAIPALKEKGVKLIALIHDLETLRGGIAGLIKDETGAAGDKVENELLRQFDIIICHNEAMKAYLTQKGFAPEKLVCLEIFDYLSDVPLQNYPRTEQPSIMIAGTLHIGKCGYIYRMFDGGHNQNLQVHLFGIHFDETAAHANQIYHGSFPPQELPKYLEGQFGLVWDGAVAETCGGNTGEYLRYNNPHKASLYLSSGIPVIIWKESAIADFVLSHKAGIAVSSLFELEDAIRAVSAEEYAEMQSNAAKLSEKLRGGYYFCKALDESLNRLNIGTETR